MLDKIKCAFKDLLSALQTAKLYPDWHPEFKKSIDKAYQSLNDALSDREGMVIGIVGEELAFEKEIFFDLSQLLKQMIIHLKERGIERIQILRGFEFEELSKFIGFLVAPKEEIKHSPEESLELLGIRNIIVGKIKASVAAASCVDEKGLPAGRLGIYEKSVNTISDSLDKVLSKQDIDYLALKFTVRNVMENLLGMHQELLNIATVKRYDLKTFYHILNVSILSMYFCARSGFSKEQILEVGTAALFHDIGKLYISRRIIQKPGRLENKEFEKMKSHVLLGAQILLRYVDALGILPVIVCFEHHSKYNLKGYPKVIHYKKPHMASMIIAMCDVYDALSQKRTYKSDYPPNIIYELMIREKGTSFDPGLIEKFFQIMGVWPLGAIVALTDQRIAVVREENEDDIFSPKVEIISGEASKEIIDLRQTKEKNKIEHFLNPFGEGKKYLHLIYSDTKTA